MLAAAALATVPFLLACEAGFAPGVVSGEAEVVDADVRVELGEGSISVSPSTANAGHVTVAVQNFSADRSHELVLLKTDRSPGNLSVLPGISQVDESASGRRAGYISPAHLPPGGSATETFTLTPGSYVLFCNIIGHYEQGMHTAFDVR